MEKFWERLSTCSKKFPSKRPIVKPGTQAARIKSGKANNETGSLESVEPNLPSEQQSPPPQLSSPVLCEQVPNLPAPVRNNKARGRPRKVPLLSSSPPPSQSTQVAPANPKNGSSSDKSGLKGNTSGKRTKGAEKPTSSKVLRRL